VKNLFGYRKTRYRGLAKNGHPLHTLFGLANAGDRGAGAVCGGLPQPETRRGCSAKRGHNRRARAPILTVVTPQPEHHHALSDEKTAAFPSLGTGTLKNHFVQRFPRMRRRREAEQRE
jgi:hypothetical protein